MYLLSVSIGWLGQAQRAIRVKDLIHHTSGLPDYCTLSNFDAMRTSAETLQAFVELFHQEHPEADGDQDQDRDDQDAGAEGGKERAKKNSKKDKKNKKEEKKRKKKLKKLKKKKRRKAKKETDLRFSPGTAYEYSNTGYMLLSLVVEAAAKQDYVAFVQVYVGRPRRRGAIGGVRDREAIERARTNARSHARTLAGLGRHSSKNLLVNTRERAVLPWHMLAFVPRHRP